MEYYPMSRVECGQIIASLNDRKDKPMEELTALLLKLDWRAAPEYT